MSCCFIQCSLVCNGEQHMDDDDVDPLIEYKNPKQQRYQCTISASKIYKKLLNLVVYLRDLWHTKSAKKCRQITLFILFLLTVLTLLIILVAFPLVIMNFPEILHNSIFKPNRAIPSLFRSNFELGRSQADCSEKPENFYVTVNATEQVVLGVWHIQPYMRHDCAEAIDIPYLPFNDSSYPVVLYFHNGFGDRRYFLDTYFELRQFFHVITFDYRGYGDSSWKEPDEEVLISDSIAMYNWVRKRTTSDLYVWGNALGAAIATRTLSLLPKANLTGLILENPFTSASDLFKTWYWPIGEILSWMPWYARAITRTLEDAKLSFNTSKYIKNINSSIMILSWPNSEIPYYFGEQLAFLASERDLLKQGSVTYNQVPWYYSERDRYSNVIPQLIRDFIVECDTLRNRSATLAERLLY